MYDDRGLRDTAGLPIRVGLEDHSKNCPSTSASFPLPNTYALSLLLSHIQLILCPLNPFLILYYMYIYY